jgi:hypothetical protein
MRIGEDPRNLPREGGIGRQQDQGPRDVKVLGGTGDHEVLEGMLQCMCELTPLEGRLRGVVATGPDPRLLGLLPVTVVTEHQKATRIGTWGLYLKES